MTLDDVAQARKEIAIGVLNSIVTRDRDAIAPHLSSDVCWWVPQSAGELGLQRPLRGPDDALNLLCGESHYKEGTMAWEHHQVLHDDGFVVMQCSMRATTKSGKDYDNQYVLIYRFDGLQIAEAWEHTDTAYAFARLAKS